MSFFRTRISQVDRTTLRTARAARWRQVQRELRTGARTRTRANVRSLAERTGTGTSGTRRRWRTCTIPETAASPVTSHDRAWTWRWAPKNLELSWLRARNTIRRKNRSASRTNLTSYKNYNRCSCPSRSIVLSAMLRGAVSCLAISSQDACVLTDPDERKTLSDIFLSYCIDRNSSRQ